MKGCSDMARAALDDAYANAAYIPQADGFPVRWETDAAAFRTSARVDLDIPYADVSGAALDLFHPTGPSRGLVVFVHGGYWHMFGKSDWSHFAEGALARDYAVAIVGYPLAPAVRISEITRLVARAVDTAAARVAGPVRLIGHSAGGHLVARLMMPGAAPACATRIVTCLPISPVADLRPFLRQSLNDILRLDEAEAATESPVLGQPRPAVRIAIHVGAEERPAFLWQADALGTAWNAPVRRIPGKHHFDVIDALRDPTSQLVTDLFA